MIHLRFERRAARGLRDEAAGDAARQAVVGQHFEPQRAGLERTLRDDENLVA